jgi:hypothetical protein
VYAWAPLGRFTVARELRDGERVVATLRRRGLFFPQWWSVTEGPMEWVVLVEGLLFRRLVLRDGAGELATLYAQANDADAQVVWRDGRRWTLKQTSWLARASEISDGAGTVLRCGLLAVEVDAPRLSEVEVVLLASLHFVLANSPTFNPLDGFVPS